MLFQAARGQHRRIERVFGPEKSEETTAGNRHVDASLS
jgi:hypothetical protein